MHKFTIVSYLDKDIAEEIINLQREIAQITGNSNALNFWKPHLTMGSGILVKEGDLSLLYNKFNLTLSEKYPFSIKLRNYGYFDEPEGIIHLKVDKNKDLLDLVSDIELITNKCKLWYNQPFPYIPHITLGYGFSLEVFNKLKRKFTDREFLKDTIMDNVCLAEETKERRWTPFKRFNL